MDSIQVRGFRWTKRKIQRMENQHRRAKLARLGIPTKKPPRYIDPKTPVINGISREEQRLRILERRKNEHLNIPVRKNLYTETDGTEIPALLLPFHNSAHDTESSLKFRSSKVAKVLALTNGNQNSAVSAQKQAGMKLFQLRPGDTGSTPVQVIALTARIQQMETHLLHHPKEHSGKRTTLILKGRRRRLLKYLERTDFNAYAKVVTTLGLR